MTKKRQHNNVTVTAQVSALADMKMVDLWLMTTGADERNRTSDLLSTTPLRSKHQKPFKGSRNLGLSHTIYSIAPPAWTATQSA